MIPERLGRHAMWSAGDVLGIHYDGAVSLTDSVQLRDILDEMYREHGHCYLLVDLRRGTGIDPDARKYMAEWSRERPQKLLGTAVYGVSFGMRAIALLMLNAIKLIGKQQAAVVFLKEEADARRWIDEQRASQLAEGPHGQ